MRSYRNRKKTSARQKKDIEWFVSGAKSVHGDKYDYSKVEYLGCDNKVCIICPEHGEFWQSPKKHLKGYGCQKCGNVYRPTTEEYIEKAKKIHGDKYDYSKVEYKNSTTKICIICPEHGEFWQKPSQHLQGNGCPKCKTSRLEKEIIKYFDELGVEYEHQKRFIWLNRKSLDFYIPSKRIAIECQGIQHFTPIKFFGGEKKYKENVKRDKEKLRLCEEKKINVIYFTHEKYYGDNIFHDTKSLFEYIFNSS